MRRWIVTALIAGIAFFSFQPFYVRIFFLDRARLAAQLDSLPYSRVPGFRELMLEARLRIPAGSDVALVTPYRDWARYGYCFHRARYLLAGRQVVPLMSVTGAPLFANLRQADYVISYESVLDAPGFVEVWRSGDGVLLRRRS